MQTRDPLWLSIATRWVFVVFTSQRLALSHRLILFCSIDLLHKRLWCVFYDRILSINLHAIMELVLMWFAYIKHVAHALSEDSYDEYIRVPSNREASGTKVHLRYFKRGGKAVMRKHVVAHISDDLHVHCEIMCNHGDTSPSLQVPRQCQLCVYNRPLMFFQ